MPETPDFAVLVDTHYRGLHWFALSLSGSSADAADLTQQTFYRWATHGHQLRKTGAVKSWLYRTLYREFLRLRNRSNREESLPDEEHLEMICDDRALERCDYPAVLAAVQRLPADQAAVVSMFYLREFSYLEIAEVLGVPIGTVMSRLARAKDALRRTLCAATDAPPATPRALDDTPGLANVIRFPASHHG